ncbi:hypothetical protein KT71_002348 [Congregibacter litoralis KT71]|uniref:Uncharacterized protein n=1 Tax=Congregibacter litoralis KT71 TaxID=314285 RepID=V7HVP8_9GAMM|nr:hypothetical protein KT71_002348 [Congregibacter litoralis KT71]
MILGPSVTAVFSSNKPLHRRWFVLLSLIAAIGMITIGLVLWKAVGLSSLSSVADRVADAKPVLSGLRFIFIAVLAISWSQLPAFWGITGHDHGIEPGHWMALRWRVVGWLITVELVLGQNIL